MNSCGTIVVFQKSRNLSQSLSSNEIFYCAFVDVRIIRSFNGLRGDSRQRRIKDDNSEEAS